MQRGNSFVIPPLLRHFNPLSSPAAPGGALGQQQAHGARSAAAAGGGGAGGGGGLSHADSFTSQRSSETLHPVDRFVHRQLKFYEDQFTDMAPLRLVTCTFNVGCRKPPSDLAALIGLPGSPGQASTEPHADIIVVGLQEVDMSAAAILKEETEAALPWVNALRDTVGADHERSDALKKYYPLAAKQLVGLLLIVFVRKGIMESVTEVDVTTIATGAMGTMGNKGAVAVRLCVNLTSYCFINAHLAAGQEHTAKRNQDIDTILSSLRFDKLRHASARWYLQGDNSVGGGTGGGDSSSPERRGELFSSHAAAESAADGNDFSLVKDHDVVFVIGDLNYRVDMPYETAVRYCGEKKIDQLLAKDQLLHEMKTAHSPWDGFAEFTPCFLPTYRFDVGTSTYDTSEKRRIPAFTDRVLHHVRDARHRGIELLEHRALMHVMSSDHKPVRSIVRVPNKVISPDKKADVVAQLRSTVLDNGLDHVAVAKTSISDMTLDFGTLTYAGSVEEARQCVVVIENVGECVAEFDTYRRTIDDDPSFGAWLRLSVSSGYLFPKETKEITVEAVLDKRALQQWMGNFIPFSNSETQLLRSLLVFSVTDGPTHFVECSVSVKPFCFGNSLSNLLRLQHVACAEAYRMAPTQEPPPKPRPHVPKEVWALVDFVYRHGKWEHGIFQEEGEKREMIAVMRHLNERSGPLPPDIASPISVGHCLLVLLRDLCEPVIPYAFYHAALQAGRSGPKTCFAFIGSLPTQNANTWIYLMSFLRFLLLLPNAKRNRLSVEVVAQVFAAVLLQRRPSEAPDAVAQQQQQQQQQHGESHGAAAGSSNAGASAGGGATSSGNTSQYQQSGLGTVQQQQQVGFSELRAKMKQQRADSVALVSAFLEDRGDV